jgi:hypothetical protein
MEFDVSKYQIEIISFRLGQFKFNGSSWGNYGRFTCNGTFTKNPPNDGTCKIFKEGQLVFMGDWVKFLKDMGLTAQDFKTW